MEPIQPFQSRIMPLPIENIDTDQIIPARYLKVTDKSSLGEGLFVDWRRDPAFALNNAAYAGAEVLLAGHNFGCGSSREHAPWALKAYGFRAILSTYFADIFRNNALKNGLLPLVITPETQAYLLEAVATDPQATIYVDLAEQTITLPNGEQVTFPIDAFSKTCLLEGIDELGYLMKFRPEVEAYEAQRQYAVSTLQGDMP